MSRRAMLNKPATYSTVSPLAYVCCYRAFIIKIMKLKDLKRKLSKLSKEQLEQDFVVVASNKTLSGFGEARVSNSNLIYTGDDDPCELVTKQSLIDDGYEKEEIEGMETIIKKGQFYVELP